MTSKAAQHIELHENSVCEWVQDKTLQVCHVPGKVNPADIFTKEMRDGAHFCRLCDLFMSCLSHFLQDSILAVHHKSQCSPHTTTPAAASSYVSSRSLGYLAVFTASSFFQNLTNVSHLRSAGQYLLRRAHSIVPPDIF
jgi:hypothetical protein